MTQQTYVLGLGSNLDDCYVNLRQACDLISQHEQITIIAHSRLYQSPALLLDNAPESWKKDYLNAAIKIATELPPADLLQFIKSIELTMGREAQAARWSPRLIDIDILACQQLCLVTDSLKIPHQELLNRNFALQPLLDVMPDWLHPQNAELNLQNHLQTELGLLDRLPYLLGSPEIMAIINITPDSFAETQQEINYEAKVQQAIDCINQGATVLDIGAESTRPGAERISWQQEWQRLQPFLDTLQVALQQHPSAVNIKLSIDTHHAETVEKVLQYDIAFINDVRGEEADKIAARIKNTKIKYIFMHQLGLQHNQHLSNSIDIIVELKVFAKQKIEQLLSYGLTKQQLIFDVGIGFAKRPTHVRKILQNLQELRQLAVPIMLGHSRKASVYPPLKALEPAQRDLETAIVSALCQREKISYLRVHNVNYTHRALALSQWLQS